MNQNQSNQSMGSSWQNWKWVVIVAALIIAGLAYYIYFYKPASVPAPQPLAGQLQPSSVPSLSAGDTTTDIANDLNRAPSDLEATQEMNSLDKDLQNF